MIRQTRDSSGPSDIPPPPLRIAPDAVASYLRVLGWHEERAAQRRSIWRHRSGAAVFVPGQVDSDYHPLLSKALGEIAAAEDRDLDDVSIDLAWRRFDKLHLHRDAQDGALRLDAALALQDALEDAIVAAARSTTDPKPSFAGRRPAGVDTYLGAVRMVPSVPGSFVVRALLPIEHPSSEPTLQMEGPAALDLRAVSVNLLTSSRAAVATAHAVADGASLDTWGAAASEARVSANLCDALSRMTGPEDDPGSVEMRISWTWDAPRPSVDPVVIAARIAPVLSAGGEFLRSGAEEHSIQMIGLVTRLHRESGGGPGEVTVRAGIKQGAPT